jgi:hypothetical protein
VIVSVAPGQSSLSGTGGATAAICEATGSNVTAHVPPVQVWDGEVVAASVLGSTTNPNGTVMDALFARSGELPMLVSEIA